MRSRAPSLPYFSSSIPLKMREGDGGLGGSAGLGDYIDGEVPVTDEGDGLQQGVSGQSVSGEEDVGGVLLLQIVIGERRSSMTARAPR